MKTKSECNLCDSGETGQLYRSELFELVKCKSCGLVYLVTSINQTYEQEFFLDEDREYYQNFVVGYDRNKFPATVYGRFLDKIEKVSRAGRLLDVGCATGVFLDMARERGWETHGVDSSRFASAYAREKFDLSVVTGELPEANYPDGHFDVVTALDLIEHVTLPSEFLLETHRILKKGGLLMVATPNQEGLINKLAYCIYFASFKRIAFPIEAFHGPKHLYYFSIPTLERMLKRYRFRVIETYKYAIPPERMGYNPLISKGTRLVFLLARLLNMEHKMVALAIKEGS